MNIDAAGQAVEAAGDGARFVEQAVAGIGIEHGAGEVGEAGGEGGFIEVVREVAGGWVAGKRQSNARKSIAGAIGARHDSSGGGWVRLAKFFKTGAKACGIGLGNGEGTEAADGATGVAREMGAGAPGSGIERGVDDLQDLEIGGDIASVVGFVRMVPGLNRFTRSTIFKWVSIGARPVVCWRDFKM